MATKYAEEKRSEGVADCIENNIQKIQVIRPHVSCFSSDQSTQFGQPFRLDSHYCSRLQKTTNPSSVDYAGYLCLMFALYRKCVFLVLAFILIVL